MGETLGLGEGLSGKSELEGELGADVTGAAGSVTGTMGAGSATTAGAEVVKRSSNPVRVKALTALIKKKSFKATNAPMSSMAIKTMPVESINSRYFLSPFSLGSQGQVALPSSDLTSPMKTFALRIMLTKMNYVNGRGFAK